MRPLNLDTILIVRTDRELHAALHGAARREGTTASALVRKAVAAIVAPDWQWLSMMAADRERAAPSCRAGERDRRR